MNWIGGARSRLRNSRHNDKKVQKMYLEKKRQETTGSVSASRNCSTATPTNPYKKHGVSQDVLNFKLQSELLDKKDFSCGGNVRVVNLGTRRAKNGVNVTKTRVVESVHLPLSPIETPSVLNLSQSPDGNCKSRIEKSTSLGKGPSYCSVEAGIRAHYPSNRYNGTSQNTRASDSPSHIELFGIPIEKPSKKRVSAAAEESRRHFSVVSSDRVCSKPSCNIKTCGVAPALEGGDFSDIQQTSSFRDSGLNNDHLHMLPCYTSVHAPGSGFKLSPRCVAKSDETSCNKPMDNYCFSGFCSGKWDKASVSSFHALNESMYATKYPDVSHIQSSNFPEDNCLRDSFQVSVVNSPQNAKRIVLDNYMKFNNVEQPCKLHYSQNTHSLMHASDKCVTRYPQCAVNVREPFSENVRENIIQEYTYPELYTESRYTQQEDIRPALSGHSPPTPLFLPHKASYDFQGINNISEERLRKCDFLIDRKLANEFSSKETRKATQTVNQKGPYIQETYRLCPEQNAKENFSIYSSDNKYAATARGEQSVGALLKEQKCSQRQAGDGEDSRSQSIYLVSSGLDCTPSVTTALQPREDRGRSTDPLKWSQVFRVSGHGAHSVLMSEIGDNATFLLKASRTSQRSFTGNLADSCDIHGRSPIPAGVCPRGRRNAERIAATTEQTEPCVLLPAPVMTSTPHGHHNSHENIGTRGFSVVSDKNDRDFRERTNSRSTEKLLLEMSALEKQTAPAWSDNQLKSSVRQEVSNVESTSRECNYQQCQAKKAVKDSTQNTHTYCKSPTDAHLDKHTSLSTLEANTPVGLSARNSVATDNVTATQGVENTVLYTPAQSISSSDATAKCPSTVNSILETHVFATYDKDVCSPLLSQMDEVSGRNILQDTNKQENNDGNTALDSRLSTDNLDRCNQSQVSTGIASSTQNANTKNYKISCTQTTPKRVQNAACSPIRILCHEGTVQMVGISNGKQESYTEL